jgi:hypothetical protein
MPKQTSSQSFSDSFHDVLDTLKEIGNTMEVHIDPEKGALQKYHQNALNRIITDLEADATADPAVILRKALASLAKVDDMRFVLQNLLEALKRAGIEETGIVKKTLDFYQHLGLTDLPVSLETSSNPPSDPHNPWGWGAVLRDLLKWLNKVALTLMEIVINAIKAIPMFIGIKPSIVVGPLPSLSFELVAESVSVAELFKVLRGN